MLLSMQSPFDDALADLRVSGSVLLHQSYQPPWCILVPSEDELRTLLGVGRRTRVLPFHFVLQGAFDLTRQGEQPERIGTHEVAISTDGGAHVMSVGPAGPPTPFTAILAGAKTGAATTDASQPPTKLLCGVFLLNSAPLNPLLSSLPPLLKIMTMDVSQGRTLMRAAQMLKLEVERGGQNSFATARLIELFCAEAIAAYRHGAGAERPGWFKALGDKRIGEALAHLHRDAGAAWTVETLAQTVAMSPSRFAACFRETTGQSVMSYVANWRMNLACRHLCESDGGLTEIASSVGYLDGAAFSRAFKALVGQSPTQWRASNRR